MWRTAAVALGLAWSGLVYAQELPFHLVGLQRTAPGVLPVVVESMNERAVAIGLTVPRAEQHVLRRFELYGLRAVRSPGATADSVNLYVRINLGRAAAAIAIQVLRTVEIVGGGERHTVYTASVWDKSGLMHLGEPLVPSDTDRLLDYLNMLLDIFIEDYMLANPRSTW
jgi:hypothetical protein